MDVTHVLAKTWNPESRDTNHFLVETKLTSLGSQDSKKTILGIIITLAQGQQVALPGEAPPNYNISFSFRDGINGTWRPLINFNSVYSTDASGSRECVYNFLNPVKDVRHFQLRIRGSSIRGEFGINDIGILYRTYRDTTVSKFDEE